MSVQNEQMPVESSTRSRRVIKGNRRTSKLLVEIIIGVLGLLGIMLAQIETTQGRNNQNIIVSDLESHNQLTNADASSVTPINKTRNDLFRCQDLI